MDESLEAGHGLDPEEQDDLADLLSDMIDPAEVAAYEAAVSRARVLERLLTARRQSTRTQSDVALQMGITQSALSELESGRVDPRLSALQRYARAVGKELRIDVSEEQSRDRKGTT